MCCGNWGLSSEWCCGRSRSWFMGSDLRGGRSTVGTARVSELFVKVPLAGVEKRGVETVCQLDGLDRNRASVPEVLNEVEHRFDVVGDQELGLGNIGLGDQLQIVFKSIPAEPPRRVPQLI